MGGRFCSLDQLYKNFSGNEVFSSPKLNEDQKEEKGLRRKCCVFSTKLGEDQKKKKKIKKKGLYRHLRPFSAGNS